MPTLTISHLTVAYGPRPIVRGLNLTLHGGEVLALVGPNGAGKSTLLRAVSGVIPVQSGSLTLDGQDLLRLTPAQRARRMAVVPQLIHLPEGFTVGEIVLMGRAPHLAWLGREGEHDCAVAWQALQRTDCAALLNRRASELSGGEQQRVVIARALTQEPQVLLLDEPTAHLDLKHQAAVLELARTLAHAEGLAVLLTLHDLNQAARYADRLALLKNGELLAHGSPAEVLTVDTLHQAYGVRVTMGTHPQTGQPVVFG